MGCLSGPKKVEATKSERELASLAREKYQYSRGIVDPLQARSRAEAKRLGSDGVRQLTVNKAVNTARENMPDVKINPNRAAGLKLSDSITSNTLARAGAEGERVASTNKISADTRNLAEGLNLSTSGSRGARGAAAADAGYLAAESEAKNYVTDATANALGNLAGTAGTVIGYKKGWFDPKPAATPVGGAK